MSETSPVSPDEKEERPAWENAFLIVYRKTGNVTQATKAAKIDRSTPRKRALTDPIFAERWKEAKEEAIDALEAAARRRAVKASDVLLIFLLKHQRPEVYNPPDKHEHGSDPDRPLRVVGYDIIAPIVSTDEPGDG
jgi:hypothetical protein